MYYVVKYTTDNGQTWSWISYHTQEVDAQRQQSILTFTNENSEIVILSELEKQQYFSPGIPNV